MSFRSVWRLAGTITFAMACVWSTGCSGEEGPEPEQKRPIAIEVFPWMENLDFYVMDQVLSTRDVRAAENEKRRSNSSPPVLPPPLRLDALGQGTLNIPEAADYLSVDLLLVDDTLVMDAFWRGYDQEIMQPRGIAKVAADDARICLSPVSDMIVARASMLTGRGASEDWDGLLEEATQELVATLGLSSSSIP